MSIAVISSGQLAEAVEAAAAMPPGAAIAPVPELAIPSAPCDSVELLSWMGWMTAGPPTLAAEALRSAGRWAWVRYRWALGDDGGGQVSPTADAQGIRHHTRSLFSETVGVGVAGYLGCESLVPSGLLAVANLDDSIDPLLTGGVIRRVGKGRKQPDYLIASSIAGGPLELLAIECKGTIKGERMAIGQMAAGVRQVLGVESDLPMRRVVFATALDLDGKKPVVRSHAIEVLLEGFSPGRANVDAAREALRDAALVRALRCAGLYGDAERALRGHFPDWPRLQGIFAISDRRMVGNGAEVVSGEVRLRADVGIDLEILQALAAPRAERGARLQPLVAEIVRDREPSRRVRAPERVQQEEVMRDGVGIRFEQQGGLEGEVG